MEERRIMKNPLIESFYHSGVQHFYLGVFTMKIYNERG